jgi:manganese transport protein
MSDERRQSGVSLSEIHRTVTIPKNVGLVKRLFAFMGPAYLVSVGYMDPGNWATDLEGGARFGYSLIWVLLMSNLMAILLQTLSARLGIVTGRDLAQACRENYSKPVAFILWILCEVAIAACDLAEVLGTAIGLNLLLKVPLLYGVIITGFDTMLFLVIQQLGIRKMEGFILMLVSTIGICFGIEVFFSKPDWSGVVRGFVPHLSSESLYVAIGIIGATVMPHNLYLHSALVQTRDVCETDECKQQACRWNLFDTAIALNAAFFVNAAILIVAASVFFRNGIIVTEIQQAHNLLTPLLGTTIASTLFALALIAAGQSSTLTGTLAGQIVMEGFLQFKMRPVLRRLVTRMLAIIPAVVVIALKGDTGTYGLLILSQVILSLQLPFAVVPLIHFTGDKTKMKQFANKQWVVILSWVTAVVIIVLNARLVFGVLSDWIERAGSNAIWIWMTAIPIVLGCAVLLIYMAFPKMWRRKRVISMPIPKLTLSHQTYTKIGVALDFGGLEEKILSHAQSIAQHHNAAIYLFHIVEGVSGQIFGNEAYDNEARTDKEYIDNLAEQLRSFGFEVHAQLGFGNVPKQLVKLAGETEIDLLIMGGHRHSGLKDILFGTTVPKVRHQLKIPVLVV